MFYFCLCIFKFKHFASVAYFLVPNKLLLLIIKLFILKNTLNSHNVPRQISLQQYKNTYIPMQMSCIPLNCCWHNIMYKNLFSSSFHIKCCPLPFYVFMILFSVINVSSCQLVTHIWFLFILRTCDMLFILVCFHDFEKCQLLPLSLTCCMFSLISAAYA